MESLMNELKKYKHVSEAEQWQFFVKEDGNYCALVGYDTKRSTAMVIPFDLETANYLKDLLTRFINLKGAQYRAGVEVG